MLDVRAFPFRYRFILRTKRKRNLGRGPNIRSSNHDAHCYLARLEAEVDHPLSKKTWLPCIKIVTAASLHMLKQS